MTHSPVPGVAQASGKPTARAAPRRLLVAKVLVGVLALALLVWLGRGLGGHLPRFAEWVGGLGVWGPVAFVAGYAVATVAFIPGSLLTLAGGAIFGLVKGTLLVLVGASTGATAAFLIGRHLARDRIERMLADKPRFATIDRAVEGEGLKIVTLLRLSPVFPFSFLNYALGLTRVRLRDYVIACLGMIPGTFLYVYYGKALGSLAAVAGGARVERDGAYWFVLGLGLVATLVVTILVTRLARRALAREVDDDRR